MLNKKIFYGWWVVFSASGISMMFAALHIQAFGAYAVFLRDDYGWSLALLSGAFALTRVESGLLGPIQGWMVDKYGPKMLLRVGMILFAFGFFLFSRLDSLFEFYASYFIISIGASLAGPLTLNATIVNWFIKKRSRALGIMQFGFSLGGLVIPLVVFSMDSIGWRNNALLSSGIILLIGLPLSTMIHHQPEDKGYIADGALEDAKDTGFRNKNIQDSKVHFTARQAMKTKAFWMITIGHSSALLIVSTVIAHLILHLTEGSGMSVQKAALVVSLMTIMQAVGQLFGASLGDLYNKKIIIMLCMAMHCIALLLLAVFDSTIAIVCFALLHGFAWGTRGPLMMAIRADFFGTKHYGTIMGFSSLGITIAITSGPLFAGYLADTTGSYNMGFIILAVLAALGSLAFLFANKPILKETIN
ncbi:MAG: MFS transporter [Dehalococcoidia bacterium]|jgi:MFS family permease|nr:MAG: Sugar phosphate permease [Chloroflexota bacterium]|tara:strand:+ start:361 stop:1611 length:1251 start_codon:yes stop_codon:yes gene_type:complete